MAEGLADGSVIVLDLDAADEWDATVRSYLRHDVYWLAGYVRGFMLHGDGEPLLVSYSGPDGTRGINVVMRRDVTDVPCLRGRVERGRFFDLATPYGYGGWLVEGRDVDGLFRAYESWCAQSGVVCEFVRFHPMLANQVACEGFYDVIPLGEVAYIDISSPEVLWANMSSTCRNRVRRAQKLGVEVRSGRSAEAYSSFRELYELTMDRVGARRYYHFGDGLYQSLRRDLSDEALVFWAEAEGSVVAASVMLACNGMMNYHLGGSVHEYAGGAAMNLLMYEAALWGCEHGCKTLYLGGGVGSGSDGVLRFKQTFCKSGGGRFYVGRRVFLEEEFRKLCLLAGGEDQLDADGFFPAYRKPVDELSNAWYGGRESMRLYG